MSINPDKLDFVEGLVPTVLINVHPRETKLELSKHMGN